MIVIKGASVDIIREARCTNCWPEDAHEGVLCIPEEVTFGDDAGFTDFVANLIAAMAKPLPEGDR